MWAMKFSQRRPTAIVSNRAFEELLIIFGFENYEQAFEKYCDKYTNNKMRIDL